MPTLRHSWSLEDKIYSYEDEAVPLLWIGALSYIEEMHIYDYRSSMPIGQEPALILVGRGTSIGASVYLHLYGEHDHTRVTSSPLLPLVDSRTLLPPEPKHVTLIGHDVWIGNGVRILSGVKIGNGAVIGAGSLVTRDIPPYAVAVGTPARVSHYRFSPEQIEKLLSIAWWEWALEKTQENVPLLLSHDIDAFINAHYQPAMAAE